MNKEKQIILVSCVGKKQQRPAPAAELYTSTWFKLARAYAEQSGHKWFILSAEYFLVPPDQIIHPYDTTLKRKKYSARQGWAKRVFNEIKNKAKIDTKIIILAGLPYREFLTDLLTEAGYNIEIPMDGLGIGQQLAWLKSQLGQVEPEPQPPAEPPAPTPKVFPPKPEFDCPHCEAKKSVAINEYDKGHQFLKCLKCNAEWPNISIFNETVKRKNSKVAYCPICNKMTVLDKRHFTTTCRHCTIESPTLEWLDKPGLELSQAPFDCPRCGLKKAVNADEHGDLFCYDCKAGWVDIKQFQDTIIIYKIKKAKAEAEAEPQPKTPPEYCKKCGTELKKGNAPFNCPKCNFEMVTQPLKCYKCDGVVNKQPKGGLKCSDCQMEWSNLRRFKEGEIANATNVETTEEINGTSGQEVEIEIKPDAQQLWDNYDPTKVREIVPDPWLPEPCFECGQIPLELEPTQEAFLEQILNMNDSNLATLDRIITMIKQGTHKQQDKLYKLTADSQKFWQAIK